ncbi:helix-turn-helix domain-containing protein [Pedobacter cryophilus]|uniref:Helix-turn-helix transcriptional regulator n=1 Tax=Pedobacter cryophilus TaxID=2571271 RepID=A0A4V5NXD7_9SPHI|nr:AraC family transcriptional regulator [Pedobacter cryophilus]TKB98883.1 helix-turn-helix transcriptional regulator [Pedobacter cryophilus]
MFLNVISLLVGFLCLFVVLLMLFNQKPNRKTNEYLIAILIVVGLQRFLYAIEVLGFINKTYSPLKIMPVLAVYIVPVYYLFFKRLIDGTGNFNKELLHFIIPTIFILINLVFVNYGINRIFYLVYSVTYFTFNIKIARQYVFKKKSSLLDRANYQTTKTWLLLMLAVTFLLVVYSNCFLFQDLTVKMNLNTFYRFSSCVWLIILIYMFKNPVIIFGEHALLKSIQENEDEPQDFQIWNHKPLLVIEDKDKIVQQTLINRIDYIILEIKTLQQSAPLISKTTLNAETLARELKIPKRHLDFIFKYYCHYSINDFGNLVKVNYALTLIKQGYLEKFTVASLGEQCLFNSRFTFSKNFKKFVGVSVSDFVSTHGLVKDNQQWAT